MEFQAPPLAPRTDEQMAMPAKAERPALKQDSLIVLSQDKARRREVRSYFNN
jgi:hypothetical protein